MKGGMFDLILSFEYPRSFRMLKKSNLQQKLAAPESLFRSCLD